MKKHEDRLVRVKVSGPGAGVIADLIHKALRDAGLTVCHWSDVGAGEGTPTRDAHKKDASVLLLEMNE